jgi:N-acyl-D-aspartate/D-glutamate deacylase
MEYQFLIKNGRIVDGTGAPAYDADVRVAGGTIVEIGADLAAQPRERVFDAAGCLVTPGFIEQHNHYDAPMWWMPTLEPMSGYGITTSVNGNCGFAPAPVSSDPDAKMAMVKIFSFFEDIPVQPFVDQLPWDWRTWSEYRASLEANLRFPVNFAAYAGHIAIRLAVMGMDARTRAATPDEIAQMCALLEDALEAGAIGLSSNLLDYDGQGQPVPSILAEDAEYEALLDVLARYPGRTFQIIIGVFMRFTGVEDMARVERLCRDRAVRVLWAGIPIFQIQMPRVGALVEEHERFKREGLDFWTGFHHVPPATAVNFEKTLVFGQSNCLVWHEMIEAPDEAAKFAMLADDAWRARARKSWDDDMYPQAGFRRADKLVLQESQTGYGPLGITFAELVEQAGPDAHPSDVLADWLLDNGLGSTIMAEYMTTSTELMAQLCRDPRAIGNASDSGAHGQMLCGIGDHIDLITDYARDHDWLTIEEAVHNLTGKLAGFFGFDDRGVLEVGKAADLVVFDLDEIERRPVEKVYDVPDGRGGRTWRYTRAPAPMRLTLCNGVPTFDRERYTGQFPGKVIEAGVAREPANITA